MRHIVLFGKPRDLLIPGLILLLFFLALALRAIPVLYTPENGYIAIFDSDSWYTLRQVEVMVHAFPQYNWFDPMTAYPQGKYIDWGPLYPALAAVLSLVLGASTRSEIISASQWLGPLLGACMVPVMYFLGKVVWDRKAGILAAALVSFATFRLFFLSSYGFVDHHIAEVLLTTLFLLCYCAALIFARDHPVQVSNRRSLLPILGVSLLCGGLYFLGLLASTSVVIVVPVIGIYTAIQISVDTLRNQPRYDLALVNTVIFLIATAALLIFGLKAAGLSLVQYSLGHVYAYLAIIAGTVLLTALSYGAKGRTKLYLILLGIVSIGALLAVMLIPPLHAIVYQGIGGLWGTNPYSLGIREMKPWSLLSAWRNTSIFLILMAGGFVFLALRLKREWRPDHLLVAVWAAFILFMTVLYSRFEYLLAVPLILLSALCVTESLSIGYTALRAWLGGHLPGTAPAATDGKIHTPPVTPKKQGGKKGKTQVSKRSGKEGKVNTSARLPALLAALVLILLATGSFISLVQAVQYGMQIPSRQLDGDWVESLSWMESHTPPPGVDYFGQYNRGFTYPEGSYGVMAVWEAGHWITFFSRRIPNVNPFQDNLMGDTGGAAFFLTPSEARGEAILTGLGSRYVITDGSTAADRFTALIPWVDPTVNTTRYLTWFFVPDPTDPDLLNLESFYDDGYYQSMLVRLHFFDGSMTLPTTATYVEYVVRQVPAEGETAPRNTIGPVVTRMEERNATEAVRDAALVNADMTKRYSAAVVSPLPTRPVMEVPALAHFRLVHESPTVMTWEEKSVTVPLDDARQVKVFEYVPGARIRGSGTIELPLVSNTGRAFTYRQESINGEFIVPYSTQGNPYEVKATGPYRIIGTTKTYDVSEEDIHSGNTVG